MTVHASKGLEFPFVLLLNAGARFNNRVRSEPFQADDAIGLGIRTADYASRATITSAAHFVLSRRAYEEGLSEELRLLYVAATRARERLWIIGHGKVGGFPAVCERVARGALPLIARLGAGSILDWILMALAAQAPAESEIAAAGFALTSLRADEVRSAFAEIAAKPLPATVTRNEVPTSTMDDEMWVGRAYQAMTWKPTDRAASTPAVLSVSALKDEARRARESDRSAYAEPPTLMLIRPEFLRETDDDDGRILGTATHRFLEHADLTRIASAAEITAQRDALVASARLSASEAALLPVDDLEWLGRSEIGRFLAENAANCHREAPFVRASPVADSREFQIVRGVIDCIVRTPDELTIVDYKTDHIRDEQVLRERFETYAVQIKLYAAAAATIFGVPVRRAALVFLGARRVMDVPLE